MDLSKLTDEELRSEFRIAVQNYINILTNSRTDDLTDGNNTVIKGEYLGEILSEVKRRRTNNQR
jgi:hypothetical protein